MSLTLLVLPTVLLQANLIVSAGMEKLDMWFNILSLLINIAGCMVGLYFIKSLTVVNYSVFFSFLAFHLAQDVLLIRKKLIPSKDCILFYLLMAASIAVYHNLSAYFNPFVYFALFSLLVLGLGGLLLIRKDGNHSILTTSLPNT